MQPSCSAFFRRALLPLLVTPPLPQPYYTLSNHRRILETSRTPQQGQVALLLHKQSSWPVVDPSIQAHYRHSHRCLPSPPSPSPDSPDPPNSPADFSLIHIDMALLQCYPPTNHTDPSKLLIWSTHCHCPVLSYYNFLPWLFRHHTPNIQQVRQMHFSPVPTAYLSPYPPTFYSLQ